MDRASATNVRLLSNAGKRRSRLRHDSTALVGAHSHEGSPRQRLVIADAYNERDQKEAEPAEPHLRIGPAALAMNATAPVNAGGWMSAAGYRFFLRGDMELKNLFRLEDLLGLPLARPAAEGAAKLDVSVSGPWQGFAPPVPLGTAQLRNVRAEMRGLNTPIEIASAAMSLTPDAVSMQKISARTGDTHWSGGVTAPRHCAARSGLACFSSISPPISFRRQTSPNGSRRIPPNVRGTAF